MKIKVKVISGSDRDDDWKIDDVGIMVSFTNLGLPYESHPIAAVIIDKKIVLIPYFHLQVIEILE